jgi:uncharacterized repeat protein (TIGR01451 family)/uncharacterized delta-60 repeat protein
MKTSHESGRMRAGVVAFLGAAALLCLGTATSDAQTYDPTFNAQINIRANAIALQSDGKVVAAGHVYELGHESAYRFNADGTHDPTFTLDPSISGRIVGDIAMLPDGRILVATYALAPGTSAVVRLLSNGALDPTFMSPVLGIATSVIVQPDGRILVAGFLSTEGDDETWALMRLEADGAIDGTFTPVEGTANPVAGGLARYADGRIVLVGNLWLNGQFRSQALVRLTSTGAVDLLYDGAIHFAGPVAVRPDGQVLVLGHRVSPTPDPTARIFQFLPDGTVDASFNTTIGEHAGVTGFALQPNGRLVIAGNDPVLNGIPTFDVVRLLLDGSIDLSFGIGLERASGAGIDEVLVQPDGKVLAAGDGVTQGLARLLPTTSSPVDADLEITKTAPIVAMVNGQTITYTISVRNLGAGIAAGVTVSDTLPTGLTYQSCFASPGVCSGLGNQRTITFGTIAPNATASISLSATITPSAGETVTNTATVTSYSTDPNVSNNSSAATSYRTLPAATADIQVTASASPQPVQPNGTVTFSVSVRNAGPSTAPSVTVNAALPAGLTFVSCSAPSGSCGGSGSARTVTYSSIAAGVTRTVTINATATAALGTTVQTTFSGASPSTVDPGPSNNSATVSTRVSLPDTDDDTLPNEWETRFGLNGNSSAGDNGRNGDPDQDGLTNEQELAVGTHPRGFFHPLLAEGAQNGFFDVRLALLNVGTTTGRVLVRYLQPGGVVHSEFEELAPGRRRTLTRPSAVTSADFSTIVEADTQVILDRTMTWAGGRGSHAETGVTSASTTWYLAEGSTSGVFSLFYLLQNPNPAATTATIRYLLPAGQAPIERTYNLPPNSRTTIPIDNQGGVLASTDVSGVVTAPLPIVVERAMYRNSPTEAFAAGHNSAGVTAPATSWFLAEGATGPFFDCFILLANPNAQPTTATIDYLLSDGRSFTKRYTLPANGRVTVWVDNEQIPGGSGVRPLANVAVSSTVTAPVPIVVERTMWWPSPESAADFWTEAHNSPGATATATRWALAEGEVGGPQNTETYILIANTSTTAGSARVTLYFEDGTSVARTFPLLPRSRRNVNVSSAFTVAAGRRFGTVIESLGSPAAQIVVERAMYTSPGGATWVAGTNALASPIR